MKTKQIVFTKPYVAELLDSEYLSPKEHEVTVSLDYSAISAGTEKANLIGMRCGTNVSEDEEMGVEVTLAWSDDVGRHNKLFQQQYPKENRTDIIKNEAKRLRVEKDLFIVENLASLWIPSGKENAIEILTEAINKKVDKLNNNDFTKYRINNLFVSAFTLFTEDIEDFLNQFSLVIKKGIIAFDAIYIFNSEKLFVFENDNIKKIAIPEGRLSTYKLKAMNNTKV